jgi:hypothetical protein
MSFRTNRKTGKVFPISKLPMSTFKKRILPKDMKVGGIYLLKAWSDSASSQSYLSNDTRIKIINVESKRNNDEVEIGIKYLDPIEDEEGNIIKGTMDYIELDKNETLNDYFFEFYVAENSVPPKAKSIFS